MRVNELISRCRPDMTVVIRYEDYHIFGSILLITNCEEYKENRIGDMLVTNIANVEYDNHTELCIKAVKA